ncbi:MAG: CHRD domain-containing protein [Dehalococcoidia bacterium]|nr:CHRD domain-containing protein [Dehalococcoidia bacterium]
MHRITPFRMTTLGLLGLLALAPLLTLWGTATARPAQAAPIEYAAALSGAAESPPVASTGTGNALVELDTAAHTLRVRVTFSGLVGTTTNAHIHAPTAVADTGIAGVATQTPTFLGFPSGVTSGTYDAMFDTTLAGSWNAA